MTLVIDLTPGEQARLRQLAAQRGRQEKEQAQEMFRRSLDSEWPEEEDTSRPGPEEMERLIAAAQGGDLEARLRLLEIAPTIPSVDQITGKPTSVMSREALRREYIYED